MGAEVAKESSSPACSGPEGSLGGTFRSAVATRHPLVESLDHTALQDVFWNDAEFSCWQYSHHKAHRSNVVETGFRAQGGVARSRASAANCCPSPES